MLSSHTDIFSADSFGDIVEVEALDWALASDPTTGHSALQTWEERVFDGGGCAELIVGADIVRRAPSLRQSQSRAHNARMQLYDPTLAADLAAMLQWLLRRRAGSKAPSALIAGTVRTEETWNVFLEEFRASLLLLSCLPVSQWLSKRSLHPVLMLHARRISPSRCRSGSSPDSSGPKRPRRGGRVGRRGRSAPATHRSCLSFATFDFPLVLVPHASRRVRSLLSDILLLTYTAATARLA